MEKNTSNRQTRLNDGHATKVIVILVGCAEARRVLETGRSD